MKSNVSKDEKAFDEKEEASTQKNILPFFWDLASNDEEKRIGRVVDLVSTLKMKSQKHEETEFGKGEIPEDLRYAMKRLVKGIGSSRKGARQGYGTALAELLSHFDGIQYETVHGLMQEHLTVKGSFTGQEERESLFGQVFCFAALIQALDHKKDSNRKSIGMFVKSLLTLLRQKSYLAELCAKLIVDILQKIDSPCFLETVFPFIEYELKRGWNNLTPEDLYILFATERLFKESLGKTFFKIYYGHSNVCDKENIIHIAKILTESTVNSHPRVHIVWKEALPHALKSRKYLMKFWSTVVEDSLMQSTHERKFLAFNILKEILPKISVTQVEVVFSEKLLKSIINGSSSEKNYLYTASKDLLSSIPSQVGKNANSGIALASLQQIMRRSGTFYFDVMTKSKTIESLVGCLDPDSVVNFVLWLKELFISGKDTEMTNEGDEVDEDKVTQTRQWAASQMLTVARCTSLKREESLLLDIAKFLFFYGHFHSLKKKKKQSELYTILSPAVEENIITLCKDRFLGVLAELSHIHLSADAPNEKKHDTDAIPGTVRDGDFFAYHILQFAKDLLDDPKHVTLNKTWTPEAKETFDFAVQEINGIREKVARDSPMSEERAFELLFLHTSLQMFDSTDEAADVIQELAECHKKLTQKKKKTKTDDEPHWSEVLTEILLSFLAQSSHMMRQIVNLVFSMILPHVTSTAFQLIIESLKPKKNAGEAGLEMVEESDEDIEVDEADADSDASGHEDNSEEESNGESEEESENEMSNDGEIDEEFKNEVKSALGDAAAVEKSDDEDSGSEISDIDMDTVDPKILDSMDKALAAAFKTRMQAKSGKKKKLEEKKAIVHFRLRVLDIAELLVKKQPKNPLILDLIEPLLEVIKVSALYKEERELHDRAQGILKNKICHAREIPNGTDVDKETAHVKIEELLKLAENASTGQMVNLITQCCMFLIRVLRGKEDIKEPSPLKTRRQRKKEKEVVENTTKDSKDSNGSLDCSRIVKIFHAALHDFMTRRNSHLQPVMFLELIKRYPTIAWKLSSTLPTYLSTAVNNFRKVQAVEMISQLLLRKTSKSDGDFDEMAGILQNELINIFNQASSESCTMKAKHLHDLVKLTDKFIREIQQKSNMPIDEKLSNSLEAAIEGPIIKRSPQLMAYAKRILQLLTETPCNGEGKKRKIKDTRKVDDSGKQTESKKNGINENGQENETKEEILETCSKPKKKKKKTENKE